MDGDFNRFQSQNTGPRKKVLFIITQSEMGGAQKFLLELAKHLSKDLYEITIAVGSDGDGYLAKHLTDFGITPLVLTTLKRNPTIFQDLRSIPEIKKVIDSFKPDTLFLLSSKAGFVGSLAAQFSKTRPKVIYRIGGWTFNDPWPAWKKKFWIGLEKMSARWKDYIIVNNTHDARQALDFGIRPRVSVELIHNGIDPYALNLLPHDEARRELTSRITGISGKTVSAKYIVGTIANFYPTKGLPYLIESVALIKDLDTLFVIIGDGEQRKHLEKLIISHDLTQRVFLLGRMDDANKYLLGFNAFVLPSVKEGFPWSILEAMSAKLPVIATSVGAVPEIIESGINGYVVPPGQPRAIAECISKVLSDDRAATEMGLQAHQTIILKFSIGQMIDKIEKFL